MSAKGFSLKLSSNIDRIAGHKPIDTSIWCIRTKNVLGLRKIVVHVLQQILGWYLEIMMFQIQSRLAAECLWIAEFIRKSIR